MFKYILMMQKCERRYLPIYSDLQTISVLFHLINGEELQHKWITTVSRAMSDYVAKVNETTKVHNSDKHPIGQWPISFHVTVSY